MKFYIGLIFVFQSFIPLSLHADENAKILSNFKDAKCKNYEESVAYCQGLQSSEDLYDTSDMAQTYLQSCSSAAEPMFCKMKRVQTIGRMKTDYIEYFKINKTRQPLKTPQESSGSK